MTKTALNELIYKWESELGSYIPNAKIYESFINDAKKYIIKEKEQICNAFKEGETLSEYYFDPKKLNSESENYYNQTYK